MNDYSPELTGLALVISDQPEKPRFTADYTQSASTRVYRTRLHPNAGGKATATFSGMADLETLRVERGGNGSFSLYAEVTRDDDTHGLETQVEVAVIPTGKRIPDRSAYPLLRCLGSDTARGIHAYLLDAGLYQRSRVDGNAPTSTDSTATTTPDSGDADGS